jgi:outer membrane protein TolC
VKTPFWWYASFVLLFGSVVTCSPIRAQNLPGMPRVQPAEEQQQSTPRMTPVPSLPGQTPILGSVPSGTATGETLQLSLSDAIDRGLRQNLGLILGEQGTRAARAQRLRRLSDLLPNIATRTSETVQQTNLAAFGFPVNLIPGISPIVGPFSVFDARATYSQRLFDWKAIQNTRSADESIKAAQLSYKDTRELVVLVVTNLYLQEVLSKSRVDVVQAQLDTANAVYQQAQDLEQAGVAAQIDVLRAQVEMQSQEQRLLGAENDLQKQKLSLARAIGIPVSQPLETTDMIPYSPLPPVTLEQALADAYRNRADYQQAQALVKSAELARSAAEAGRYPSVRVDGDYGVLGRAPGSSHGTFTAAASLQIPIFQGGKVRADVLENDALLQQRQAQLSDLHGEIENEVRTAFLDVNTAARQVQVAQSSISLANQQLQQSRDRLAAGVANTLEVVQAQEALAAANETYLSALYAHNLAKASLARAAGVAEQTVKQYLGGK